MKQIRNRVMVLIPKSDYTNLKKAGSEGMTPIIKLFVENLTWLVTGIDEDGILYGYADLGMDCVEWGSLCHEDELPNIKGRIAYLERDRHWTPKPEDKYLEMNSLIGV